MKTYLLNILDIIKKLHYLLNHRQRVLYFVVFVMSLVGALLETLGVSVILPLVEAITDPQQLLKNSVVKKAYNFLGLHDPNQVITMVIVGVILVFVIKNLYLILLSYVRASYSSSIQLTLGVRMMKSYMSRGYQYFVNEESHMLHRGLTGDVQSVNTIIHATFCLISELLTDLTIIIFIVYTDPFIALFLFLIAAVLILSSALVTKNKLKKLGEENRYYDTKVKRIAYQTFGGIKDILVMHRQKYFIDTYKNNSDKLRSIGVKQTVTQESPTYIFEAVCVAGLMIGIALRMGMMEDAARFIPALATIAMAAFRIMPSLGRIASYNNNIMFNVPAMNACYRNVKEAEKFQTIPESQWQDEGETGESFHDTVAMNHIWFHYDKGNGDVLQDLSLQFHKGESIGLIGESGAGKSTVADMLLGLLEPQRGAVTVDGKNIRDIPNVWCRTIGYVPQTVYIMDDTIRVNIAFGVPEDQIDDAKVWKALEEAQLKEFVEGLPDGLDTMLGERGIRFSGGQRQRIAIARALYYDPEILVLDEATSALDNKTEEAVMESIDYLSGRKTLVIVAHRLTTIRNCNYVYEIADGKAVRRETKEVLASE